MKILITLSGSGGELAREIATVGDSHPDIDEAVNLAIGAVIETWRLSVGDCIKIEYAQ